MIDRACKPPMSITGLTRKSNDPRRWASPENVEGSSMLPPARWQRFCRTRPAAATRQSCAGGSLEVVACAAVVSMCFRSSHGWLLKDMVRNGCGASAGELAGRLGDVELGRVFAVGGAVLAAFFELHPQFNDLLFESDDALLKLVDVGGCTESGCAPGLFAEQFGRVSSCWVRAAMRVQRCWAASRSARSEARVTGGPSRVCLVAGLQRRGGVRALVGR
jgi:hypothetical protein